MIEANSEPEPPRSPQIEQPIEEFEQAWNATLRCGTNEPVLETFLPAGPNRFRDQLHRELLLIETEFRWRLAASNGTFPKPLTSDDLQRAAERYRFNVEFLTEWVAEEYRARRRRGDRLGATDYGDAFGDTLPNLVQVLKNVDAELAADRIDRDSVIFSQQPAFSPVRPDSRAPLNLEDYLIQRMIGCGGLGKVYRAWQRSLDRPVAIKFLRKKLCADTELVDRFLAEAKTIARFDHPNLMRVHGVGHTSGGVYFFVMNWIKGTDLERRRLARPVGIHEALGWIRDAVAGIAESHRQGIIHCDLKPANLLLDEHNRVRVTDFGLSRRESPDPTAANSATHVGIDGTAPYMAPEQISDSHGEIGPHTDVYGLGAVLFTLLTGQSPVRGRDAIEMFADSLSARPIPSVREIRPEVPADLNRIVMQALAKNPTERFPSVQAFGAELSNRGAEQ